MLRFRTSIHAWAMSGHGKKIQHSGIGSILADLKHKAVAPLEVDKFFPSTKLCPKCGKKNHPMLKDRIYQCECGYELDRDTKSAICIRDEALKQIPVERREFTLGEISSSTFIAKLKNQWSQCKQDGVSEPRNPDPLGAWVSSSLTKCGNITKARRLVMKLQQKSYQQLKEHST